jgi:hypothetical protein
MAAPAESNEDELAGQHSAALSGSDCPRPAVHRANSCSSASGTIKFQVTLPSGQAYVEVFSRQNGIQNVANNIVGSASDNGDGTSTYSFERSGYLASDHVEYRFYSYLPNAPGLFTPGPAEQVWLTHVDEPQIPAPQAQKFIVDRVADSDDGVCASLPTGRCNLRAAVSAALLSPVKVTIELQSDSLVELGPIAIDPASALDLTITASEQRRIDGLGFTRLFAIGAQANLKLDNVVIENFRDFDGGALTNAGTLSITRTTFSLNTAYCSGVGAMTAFATCGGGAISNSGSLTIGAGSRFVENEARAEAWTASFTNASAFGGAIASSGSILVNGSVEFLDNRSTALAQSGIHPGPGGAWASSLGGAILSGGSLTFVGDAIGHCTISNNGASATASAVSPYIGTSSSAGGAIYTSGELVLPSGACLFSDNQADSDSDVHVVVPEPASN